MTTDNNATTTTTLKVTPVSASRNRGKHSRRQFLRSLVQKELERRAYVETTREDTTMMMEGVVQTNTSSSIDGEEHSSYWKDLSEDELLQFLEELEHDESRFAAEEMEQSIELEHEYLQDQWREYEQWSRSSDDVVICPICHEGTLLPGDGCIVCSNGMDDSCSFRLYSELSVNELLERLRWVHEEHSNHCRALPRIIQMDDESLLAVCPSCGMNQTIVG